MALTAMSSSPPAQDADVLKLIQRLHFFINAFLRSWWLVLLAMLAAITASLYMTTLETPLYQTSARFIVSPTETLDQNPDIYGQVSTLDDLMATYAEVFQSESILLQATADLDVTYDDLRVYSVNAVVLPEANIVEVSSTGPDPVIAATLTNEIGQEAISYITGLYRYYDISLLDPASIPSEPYSPQPVRSAALAGAIGLMVGIGLALGREALIAYGDEA